MATFIHSDVITPDGDGEDLSSGETVFVAATAIVAGGTNSTSSDSGIDGVDMNATIEGEVWGNGFGIDTSTDTGNSTDITVGVTGSVIGATRDGIAIFSGGSVAIQNAGEISGSITPGGSVTAGIDFYDATGGNQIENSGIISGNTAILIQGDGNSIDNSGTIAGGYSAIIVENLAATASIMIDNSGTIEAKNSNDFAISLSNVTANDGSFTVTNSGHIVGGIGFSSGNDVYDGSLGSIVGLVNGAGGNDVLTGGAGTDNLEGGSGSNIMDGMGGNDNISSSSATDRIEGGDGNDNIYVSNFAATDQIDGGTGTDTLYIAFAPAAQVVLTGDTLANVEKIVLATGGNYSLKMADGNVAAGAWLTIDASALTASEKFVFDGSEETDGHYKIISGKGADVFTSGKLSDIFVYQSAADSTSTHYDTITNFNASLDEIRITGSVTAIDTAITAGTLSGGSKFDADLKKDLTSLGAHHAVEFTPSAGGLKGDHFLVVDLNGTAGYQAGHDLVIELGGNSTNLSHLSTGDFI